MAIPLHPPRPRLPDLAFSVEEAVAMHHAAAPSIGFRLGITEANGGAIDSVMLQVQLRLSAGGRRYLPSEKERLSNIFGRGEQWARSVGSLHWTNVTTVVPPFSGQTSIELAVSLTYDFEVSTAQYFQALETGEIPVDLLFSGTVLYPDDSGALQVAMIPWDREARWMLPVSVWREAMDAHFPDSAWLRLSRGMFDQLQRYRARHPATNWDDTLAALLGGAPE